MRERPIFLGLPRASTSCPLPCAQRFELQITWCDEAAQAIEIRRAALKQLANPNDLTMQTGGRSLVSESAVYRLSC